jgi:hypothetical protein
MAIRLSSVLIFKVFLITVILLSSISAISQTNHKKPDNSSVSSVSVKDFGAIGNGSHDDITAFELARDYVIEHPAVLIIPIGNYFISRPFMLQSVKNRQYQYFTIHLSGMMPNKSAGDQYLSKITCGFRSGFGIGMQLGRGIVIENITIVGQYMVPHSVTNFNIGTKKFSDWNDPTITDTKYAPYCGISIDPYKNFPVNNPTSGTSDVTIQNCSIHQFVVGIALSPNGQTQNDEMINILEDNIDAVKICIAVCQDQSKTVNIKGLKVWASAYTVVDGLKYGAGTGGGSVFCENWNIAGNCKELFNLNTSRFPLSVKDIYAESLFRIGYVGNGTGTNFINCQIDFLTGNGMPEADYLLIGQANFYGGTLRYYDSDYGHRLNLTTLSSMHFSWMFRDMTVNNYPLITGIYGMPTNRWHNPVFDNVAATYTPFKGDTIFAIGITSYKVDRDKWTATVTGLSASAKVNDYLIGEPTDKTCDFYDYSGYCITKILGRITSIIGNTATLNNVPVNMYSTTELSRVFISRLK